ncbi:hypothetical protein [Candidatus Binatus sp.]|uniref:hypothetical protein n=1 Tax=Candidatus Binatus sp. TaxID=2811406 RepID=UPI002F94FD37
MQTEESAPIAPVGEKPLTIRNDLTLVPPSGDMTRQVVIYRNTWVRLIGELDQCKLYGAGVLSNLASGAFGILLSAGIQTKLAYDPKQPSLWVPWVIVAACSFFACGVFAYCAHYVRKRENASLQSVIAEMEEHRERWG